MDRRTFEIALRAAAKLTIGTSFLGCSATVSYQPDPEESVDGGGGEGAGTQQVYVSSSSSVTSTAAQTTGAGPEVCAQPAEPEGGWWAYDEATFACCSERVAALAPDPLPEGFWTQDAGVTHCCAQILSENYEAIWSGMPLPHPVSEEVLDACCVHAHGNVACTPWGPPCPIAMDPTDALPWLSDEFFEVAA